MTDYKRQKTLAGMSACTDSRDCEECPYSAEYDRRTDCMYALIMDMAEMIDEQAPEPRVLTLEEIKDGESYWFSAGKEFVTRPVICVHREDDARKPYITFAWQFGTFSFESKDYGKAWRCWTARPTDEQRKAVKWDDD